MAVFSTLDVGIYIYIGVHPNLYPALRDKQRVSYVQDKIRRRQILYSGDNTALSKPKGDKERRGMWIILEIQKVTHTQAMSKTL